MKIKILKPVAGTYGLSSNINEVIKINDMQASEMIKSGHAIEIRNQKSEIKNQKIKSFFQF